MKKIVIVLLVVITTVLCSGCEDKNEIEKLAIALGVGYDLSPNGEYIVTIQAIKPQQSSEEASGVQKLESGTLIHSARGKAIHDAFNNMQKTMDKPPYFSHVKFILVGEELAHKGIELVVDTNLRGKEMRPNVPIFVCKGYSYDYLNVKSNDQAIPANAISNIMRLQSMNGFSFLTSSVQLYNSISGKNKYNITGVIDFEKKQEGSTKSDIFNVSESAIFKKDKLVGYLDKQTTNMVALLKDNVKGGDFTIETTDNTQEIVVLEIADTKSKKKMELKDDKISMQIKVDIKANIMETNYKINPKKDPKKIFEIEQIANEKITEQIKVAVTKIQKENKMDVLDFGDTIRKNNPKVWKDIEEDWDKIFPDLNVSIEVNTKIQITGSIAKPAY